MGCRLRTVLSCILPSVVTRRINIVLLISIFLGLTFTPNQVAIADVINFSDYYLLEPGFTWTFIEDGLNTTTETVLYETVYLHNKSTRVIYTSGGSADGLKVYHSFNEQGWFKHKEFMPNLFIEGFGFSDVTIIFDTPFKMANATVTIGQLFSSNGTGTITYSGIGTFNFSCNSTFRISGYEYIEVPIGRIKAIKLEQSLTLSININGEIVSSTATSTHWGAKDIGSVKGITHDGTDTTITELTNINFQPPIQSEFIANPVNGISPLVVNFTDSSEGHVTNWNWNFGDGTNSSLQNPTHTYSTPGTYAVTLQITGIGGTFDSKTIEKYIRLASAAADINSDMGIDLVDAILCLQVLSDLPSTHTIQMNSDINGDYKIGLEEMIYILQYLSEQR